ncbi:hypothetical protein G7Y89_g10285 [Cudoniella acicularis]|uniref:DNA endonuclease activator Ctp1 C-terminal domain-containing protein n=1 Tax=Cudoniella acicularis TaxID=354080 RepID=A0A8H4VZ74_9HELO|nr:hypothetical protein G7Y89_g10285 [Cudoniella acicularis]
MESWRNGRDELFEELTRICNRIDQNVAAEIDDENFTTVARDELRYLRERSTKLDAIEEENARITEELHQHTETTQRVEVLEKENRRLAEALEKSIQQAQNVGTPATRTLRSNESKETPGSSGPMSSAHQIGNGESSSKSNEKYNNLVSKYNTLYIHFSEVKDARQQLEDLLRKQNEKTKSWTDYAKSLEKTFTKRKGKAPRQEGESVKVNMRTDAKMDLARKELQLVEPQQPSLAPGELARVEVLVSLTKGSENIENETEKVHDGEIAVLAGNMPGANFSPVGVEEVETLDLPTLPAEPSSVDDTQFVALECHHSSSTQDDPTSPLPEDKSKHHTASQDSPAIQPTSPEEPVIISCRSLRKRKTPHQPFQVTPVSKIKVETITSSPIGLAALNYLDPDESIDLDDIGEKVDTPKKRRYMLQLSRKASGIFDDSQGIEEDNEVAVLNNGSTDSAPRAASDDTLSRPVGTKRMQAALQPLNPNKQMLPRTSDGKPPKKRRRASDKEVESLVEDGELFSVSGSRNARGQVGSERLDGLLSAPSPPKRILSPGQSPRVSPPGQNQHTRSKATATSGLAREVVVNKGNESDGASSTRSGVRRSPEPSQPSSKGTIGPSKPSSRTPRASTKPMRPASKGTENGDGFHKTPAQASGNRSRENLRASVEIPIEPHLTISKKPLRRDAEIPKSAAKSRPTRKGGVGGNDSGSKPLRDRPLDELDLDDFRINPNYNQGYNYAFTNVVRNQDERRCLTGCTKPECCGKQFRALAEMMLDDGRARTSSQEQADERLLEDFLGGNSYKLQNMSKNEKWEVLLQAKTRDLANKYGKHRHAYERRKSPPGFWDTDFPTTQEEIVEREKTKAYVRELVTKRYEEAMRPGGAYIFRDEQRDAAAGG